MRGIGRGVLSSHPLQSSLGSVDSRSNVVVCRFYSADVVDHEKIRFQATYFKQYQKSPVVTPQSSNQLMVETAYSVNLALGDKMNVVQIRYGLVGPNTTWQLL